MSIWNSTNEKSVLGSYYVFWVWKSNGGSSYFSEFPDRPMFSHTSGKLSPRPNELHD